jgi:hypothetical protein
VFRERKVWSNPNAPQIDAASGGIINAVVFLRRVQSARDWDHPPVRIEQHGCQFHLLQGHGDSRVGFVRVGDSIEMVSRDSHVHSLHAGGSAYFTYAFPDPDHPLHRSLTKKGIIELTSGAGYFWMRAYVFVDDHPYYARTDEHGEFVLKQVPPGTYEVVCWMPNWHESRHDRDPESGLVSRLFFASPVEKRVAFSLRSQENRRLEFSFMEGDFASPALHPRAIAAR